MSKAGGVREPDDWSKVVLHFDNDAHGHLVVHEHTLDNEVIVEVHDGVSLDGSHELTECRMEEFSLTKTQCMELAVYLLSVVKVI